MLSLGLVSLWDTDQLHVRNILTINLSLLSDEFGKMESQLYVYYALVTYPLSIFKDVAIS